MNTLMNTMISQIQDAQYNASILNAKIAFIFFIKEMKKAGISDAHIKQISISLFKALGFLSVQSIEQYHLPLSSFFPSDDVYTKEHIEKIYNFVLENTLMEGEDISEKEAQDTIDYIFDLTQQVTNQLNTETHEN